MLISATPHLTSATTLQSLADVNLQALQLMRLLIERNRVPRGFGVLMDIRESLCRLDDAALRRLASIPHLLVDLNFRDVGWWRSVHHDSPRAVATGDRVSRAARPRLTALARATLTFTWHVARVNRTDGMLLLGLSEAVVTEISTWTPDQIQRTAERQALRLTPRWNERPMVWYHWIEAASTCEPEALRRMRIHGLQLLGAELYRSAS
jgi:hypothetical protein